MPYIICRILYAVPDWYQILYGPYILGWSGTYLAGVFFAMVTPFFVLQGSDGCGYVHGYPTPRWGVFQTVLLVSSQPPGFVQAMI